MSDQTVQLLQLLKEGKTCNEICSILRISNKQLFNNLTNLKNKGILVKAKYYANGIISYRNIHALADIDTVQSQRNLNIITSHQETEFKSLLISDLHFGNSLERLDLLDKAFEYCINNGIHIIFCCGDLIDGTFSQENQNIKDTYMQIEHFVKHYPFDKNILTFGVAGDHDISALWNNGQNIVEILKNYRHDIIIGGYNNTIVNIKNDKILLYHSIMNGKMLFPDAPIILHGHPHKYGINIQEENTLQILVPSLSDINQSFPTAIEMNLQFKKGYIELVCLKQIFFESKNYVLNEIEYDLLKNRDVPIRPIHNEETMKIEHLFEISKEQETHEKEEKLCILKKEKLSQIEKFNQKYGL